MVTLRSILASLSLGALALAACPTGEVLPHPPCARGLDLVGQGADQRCAAVDAGRDASPNLDAATGDGAADTDATAPDAALPCAERCQAPSVCDGEQCVPCRPSPEAVDPGCDESAPHCDVRSDPRACRQCLSGADCPDPLFARCEDGACVPCEGADDCLDQDERSVCDDGACVECTVPSEADDCGPMSCDPATRMCTETRRHSRLACQSCVADSECEDGHHCVPMDWAGVQRPDFYCLPDPADGCQRIYATLYTDLTSASGAQVDSCGPDDDLTTCEAVREMRVGVRCEDAPECGDDAIAEDGVCTNGFCTIPCGTDAECPLGQLCAGSCARN